MNNSPIGVFDSGLGGLSVWNGLYKGLPHESLIYYGDGKNCPYGEKKQEEVIGYADQAVSALISKGAKMIVIACNTATAMAVDYLRGKYDIPFVGLEPAVKPAALGSKSGVIGILATDATFRGRHFRDTSARYENVVEIIPAVGKGFVELVENDMEDSPEAVEAVRNATAEMISRGADRIVLGCTHYPFLEKAFRDVIGSRDIILLDSAPAILKRVKSLLDEYSLNAGKDNVPRYEFLSSADESYRMKIETRAKRLESNRNLIGF